MLGSPPERFHHLPIQATGKGVITKGQITNVIIKEEGSKIQEVLLKTFFQLYNLSHTGPVIKSKENFSVTPTKKSPSTHRKTGHHSWGLFSSGRNSRVKKANAIKIESLVIKELDGLIDKLDAEINSRFPYLNKERKKWKKDFLIAVKNHFQTNQGKNKTLYFSLQEIIKQYQNDPIKSQIYNEIMKGKASHRTHNLVFDILMLNPENDATVKKPGKR